MIMSIKLWKIFFNTGIYMCNPNTFCLCSGKYVDLCKDIQIELYKAQLP